MSEAGRKIERIIDEIKGENEGNIVHVERIEERASEFVKFPQTLHPKIKNGLEKQNIYRLYSHQAEAIEKINVGKHTVIVTPTASGKSLCYNIPVATSLIEDKTKRVLYLFPTKALSRDQCALTEIFFKNIGDIGTIGVYDGDTPSATRKILRDNANCIITNPDMLHAAILPHHNKWIKFFKNLKYVIIDELHYYRGILGSNVANVIRRLKRIANFHNSNPQFILSSATIANPSELAERLIEDEVTLVSKNGGGNGLKYFMIYNPPLINPELGIRADILKESAKLGTKMLKMGLSTIIFSYSRQNVEIITKYIKDDLGKVAYDEGLVRSYRGGYLPNTRREIEKGLRDGTIECVVSTNALELGIDIGTLDCCIITGFPGTITSTLQQSGRAGRKNQKGLTILVTRNSPIDQYISQNPQFLFSKSPECGRINPDNVAIYANHIKVASFEIPFSTDEKFGKLDPGEYLEYMTENNLLRKSEGKYYYSSENYPASEISLRSISPLNFTVVDATETSRVIAEVDYESAPLTIFEGAIYLLESELFYIDKLDYEGRCAYARRVDCDYFTEAISYTKVRVLTVYEKIRETPISISLSEILVNTRAIGYKKIKFHSCENIGYGDINLPPREMHTTAFTFKLGGEITGELPHSIDDVIDGIISIAKLFRVLSTVSLMCDSKDLSLAIGSDEESYLSDSRSSSLYPTLNTPDAAIYLFDNYPSGIGLSEGLKEIYKDIFSSIEAIINRCNCENGCPSCTGPLLNRDRKPKETAKIIISRINEWLRKN